MERIIGVNSNTYHGYSIEEAIEGIKKAGFQYIELTATKGWTEHVFPTMGFRELWKIKEKLQEEGLIPFSISGHCSLMDRSRRKDFIDNMRLGAFFGCQYIVSSIGEAHLEDKAEISDEKVAEHIKEIIPYLEEYDLFLALENHGIHGTGKQLKGIVDRVDSPRVLINYDTANAIFYGNVNIEEDLDACIDKIGHMHLKDKAGLQKEWNFPPIGKGYIPFHRIMEKLQQAGNYCPISIEIEFTQEGPKDLKEINQGVQDSYAYLQWMGLHI